MILNQPQSVGSALGQAIGSFAGNRLQSHYNEQQALRQQQQQQQLAQLQEAQEQSLLQQALQGAQQVYDDSSLSPEQKQIGLYKALGRYPQLAKGLSDSLAKQQKEAQKQNLLSQILGGQTHNENLDNLGAQTEVQSGPQTGELQPRIYSNKEILAVSQIDPNLAKLMQSQNESLLSQQKDITKRKHELEDFARKEEVEIAKPVLQELNQARKNVPLQEQAIEDIVNASPEVGIRDYLADVFHFEPLRTTTGSQLKTAIKDFFLSDLSRAGARPNQWIEQQLADALPKVGRSPEANLTVAEGMRFKVDLAKKRIETIDKLAEQDKAKFGYVKGDIDARAYNEMKPYVLDRQKELKEKIEEIKERYKPKKKEKIKASPGFVLMRNPDTGEEWEIPVEKANEARKAAWIEVRR